MTLRKKLTYVKTFVTCQALYSSYLKVLQETFRTHTEKDAELYNQWVSNPLTHFTPIFPFNPSPP